MTRHAPATTAIGSRPKLSVTPVWLYQRFCLSFRDVEDLLAQRGITVSYEAIRHWCLTFGPKYARTLGAPEGRQSNTP